MNQEDFKLFRKYNLELTYKKEKNEKLINQLYYRPFLHAKTDHLQNPKILLLMHGNYSCNLNCVYCEHHMLREDYQRAIMSEEIAAEIITKLGPMLREITWHGGEPTLLPESLVESVEHLKYSLDLDFKTSLQTNATLLTDKKIQWLESLNIQWGTSFDGLDNTNNRGALSTKAILDLYKEAKNKHISGFITVYTKDTAHHMIENYEYYKTLGVHGFQSCIVRENVVENTNPYLLSVKDSVDYMLNYINYWIHDTNNPIEDRYIIRHIQRLLGRTTICEDGDCIRAWLIADPFGNIGHCGQSQNDTGFVNIKDIQSYKDLLYHPNFLEVVNKQKKLLKKCQESGCPWVSVCNGGCMGNNYEHDSTYNEVNPRGCQFTAGLLEGIYELIKDVDIEDPSYNPIFIKLLKDNCYFSLTEIKEIEERKKKENNV